MRSLSVRLAKRRRGSLRSPLGSAKTGGKGIRTPDLLIANETLYQLSYTPNILNTTTLSTELHSRFSVLHTDLLHCGSDCMRTLQNSVSFTVQATRQTAIWYLSGPTLISGAYGPMIASGYTLIERPISTRTASPITCFMVRASREPPSSISTTMSSPAAPMVQRFRLAGA